MGGVTNGNKGLSMTTAAAVGLDQAWVDSE